MAVDRMACLEPAEKAGSTASAAAAPAGADRSSGTDCGRRGAGTNGLIVK